MQELIAAAKKGDNKSFNEVMRQFEGIFYQHYAAVARNKDIFPFEYQAADYKEEYPSIIWDALQRYDESRATFSTFFTLHLKWDMGVRRRKVARGYETPISGISEDEEISNFVQNNYSTEDSHAFIDVENFLAHNNLSDQESFIIQRMANGYVPCEIYEEFKENYGSTKQWMYMAKDNALKKMGRRSNLVEYHSHF